jgi:hypothetical protein
MTRQSMMTFHENSVRKVLARLSLGLLIMDAQVEPAHDGGEVAIPTQRKLL